MLAEPLALIEKARAECSEPAARQLASLLVLGARHKSARCKNVAPGTDCRYGVQCCFMHGEHDRCVPSVRPQHTWPLTPQGSSSVRLRCPARACTDARARALRPQAPRSNAASDSTADVPQRCRRVSARRRVRHAPHHDGARDAPDQASPAAPLQQHKVFKHFRRRTSPYGLPLCCSAGDQAALRRRQVRLSLCVAWCCLLFFFSGGFRPLLAFLCCCLLSPAAA